MIIKIIWTQEILLKCKTMKMKVTMISMTGIPSLQVELNLENPLILVMSTTGQDNKNNNNNNNNNKDCNMYETIK